MALKTNFKVGLALAMLYCFTNLYYSYSMWVGSFFVTDKKPNKLEERRYNSGDIVACFLALIYGMAYFGFAVPNF